MLVTKQLTIVGLADPAEEDAEIEAGYVWREALYSAIRAVVRELGGYEVVAAALDRRWGIKGRPVSATLLRAALNDTERNNARVEWLDFFACRSKDVAELMGRRVKPRKTVEEYAADLEIELREELSHKRAEAVLRRARTR
jgi:hypothetical protein